MTIGIYGCGWLGESLAIHFLSNNFSSNLNNHKGVIASTTTKEKLQQLLSLDENSQKIHPLYLKITDHLDCSDYSTLTKPDVFIINIPPKLNGQASGYHFKQIQMLFDKIYDVDKKYLFISSTSVYGELQGDVTEETACTPSTPQGEELLMVEKFLLGQMNPSHQNTTILRFGGLIDEKRHPAKYLSGRKGLTESEAPVNLIHRQDCIGIIDKIIVDKKWGEVYNGVCDEHSSRYEFYTKACDKRGLPRPEFSDRGVYKNYKEVSNQKIRQVLKYSLLFPKLIQF